MPSYWKHVNQVLDKADIIIEVLDARAVKDSRNIEIERKVEKSKKKLLVVINKCDLVDINKLKGKLRMFKHAVFISSKDHLGTTILKKKILELSRGNQVTVAVVGYPNVGKSSLINALAGRGAARTSSESGYTKGYQLVRVDRKIMLLDSPGVYPHKEKNIKKHSRIGAAGYSKIKDPEMAAIHLINDEKKIIEKKWQIQGEDADAILEAIAFKFGKLQKGGKPNIEAAARFLLKEWQTGRINK